MEGPVQAGTIPTPEEIVQEHAPRVYRLLRRMLGNEADAEDVTQDVLLQALTKLSSFRGQSAFTTWLHRIAVNAALAHRRKQATREVHRIRDPLDTFLESGGHATPIRPWSRGPEQLALDAEQRRIVEAALDRLPDDYRDVIVLADVEGMANADIAELLGITLSAVKSRLHRARLTLRNELAPHFEETPA